MRKLFCLFLIALLSALMLVGCNAQRSYSPLDGASLNIQMPMAYLSVMNANAGEKNSADIELSEIKEGITLGRAFEVLGTAFSDDRNSLYPIVYNWKLDGNKKLYIVFETENYNEFLKKYQNREYILPDEQIEVDPSGIQFATPNEIKVISEWLLNYRATCAYVTDGDSFNPTFLFEKSDADSGTLPDSDDRQS